MDKIPVNGSIGLVHQKTFLAYAEQFFLWILGLRKNFSFKDHYWICTSLKPHVFSMVEKEIDGVKKLCYAEAVAHGFKVEEWPGRYAGRENTISWVNWQPNTCNLNNYKKAVFEMAEKDVPYDFMTIIFLMIYCPFGIWLGPRNREKGIKRVICGEAVAYNINNGKKACGDDALINKPWMAQPWDFYYLGKPLPEKSRWKTLLVYFVCYSLGFWLLAILSIIYAVLMLIRKSAKHETTGELKVTVSRETVKAP